MSQAIYDWSCSLLSGSALHTDSEFVVGCNSVEFRRMKGACFRQIYIYADMKLMWHTLESNSVVNEKNY